MLQSNSTYILLILTGLTFFTLTSCLNKEARFKSLISSARENIKNKRYESADEDLIKAIDLRPDTAIGYVLRGKVFYFKEKNEQAKKELYKALTCDPNNTEALFYLGLSCSNLNQEDSAIIYYNKAIASKMVAGGYFELNKMYFREDVRMEALRFYRGVSYYFLEKYKEAYDDFTFALSKNYHKGLSYYYVGMMQYYADNNDLACKYLRLAVDNGDEVDKTILDKVCK